MKPRYTTVQHDVRLKLELSLIEYCLADSIDKLSNRPNFPWCELSRPRLGDFIGVSETTVKESIKKLETMGLIEVDPDTRKLRTTTTWHKEVNVNGSESDPPVGRNLTQGGSESDPLYIYKDNNKDNSVREENSLTPSLEDYLEESGVTTEYEDSGDDGVSRLVYRRDGKVISEKKLKSEYAKRYPAPSQTPKKAPRTHETFNHDTLVASLQKSSKKVEKIIALVWKERGYHFDNYDQWRQRMGQDVKYARQLEGYTPSQVRQVIDVCNREEKELNYKWSMSTLAKKIANVSL